MTGAEETAARGRLGNDSVDHGARPVPASSFGNWSSQTVREEALYRVTAEFTLHSSGCNVPFWGVICALLVLSCFYLTFAKIMYAPCRKFGQQKKCKKRIEIVMIPEAREDSC